MNFREREIDQNSWPWKHGFELHGSTYTQIFFNSKPDGTIRSTAGWIHGCGTMNRKGLTIPAICECVESLHPNSPHCSRLHCMYMTVQFSGYSKLDVRYTESPLTSYWKPSFNVASTNEIVNVLMVSLYVPSSPRKNTYSITFCKPTDVNIKKPHSTSL